MKSVSTMEARAINGGAITGVITAKCAYCGKKFKSRWWFTQSSKNTATVVAKGLARKCYYSHFADL